MSQGGDIPFIDRSWKLPRKKRRGKGNRMEKQPSEFGEVQKRICSWTLSSNLIIAVLLLFLQEKAVAKGLILGAFFSIANFLLLGKSIPMVLGHSRRKASLIGFISLLFRYLLLAIPMVIALKSPSFDFVAVVFGIFSVQIVTLVDYILIRPLWTEK